MRSSARRCAGDTKTDSVKERRSGMKLIDYETKQTVRREEAADQLRRLADDIARHNELRFDRDGKHYTVDVADDVVFSIEIEVGKAKSEIEIKVKWRST